MAEQIERQIFDAINKAKRILIVLPQSPNGDALGAGLAMFDFLKKLDKEPELISSAKDLSSFNFLPGIGEIKPDLVISQSFVISVYTHQAQLDELSYEVQPERVDIFLKPKTGKFAPKDVTFRTAKFPYDLIVTLDVQALDHLGRFYERNTDLFFETTIVNIDHHPNNEHYGEINLVDLTATSTSEILASLIENFEASLIDENIATNLLTGIIVETNSFQHVKTTPRAFLRASNLIALGGKHQEIIRELYKTKHIGLLKLWGRALARLKEVRELGLAYSLVNQADMAKAGASRDDVFGVMKELAANLAGRKVILVLAEVSAQEILGFFHVHPTVKPQLVAGLLGGQMLNGSFGTFLLQTDLLQAEQEILGRLHKIRDQLGV